MPTSELTPEMLYIRDTPTGNDIQLKANFWQSQYEQKEKQRNIVWQIRQTGMTTWSLAKAFLHAINKQGFCVSITKLFPGQKEALWRTAEGFSESLSFPPDHKNSRSFYFKYGKGEYSIADDFSLIIGREIDFLHLADFDWWTEKDQQQAFRHLFPKLTPNAQVIIQSTPRVGSNGMYRKIWRTPEKYGFVRHYFPWYEYPGYTSKPIDRDDLTEKEEELVEIFGLSRSQIGWRREIISRTGRKFFKQNYAEDIIEMFRRQEEANALGSY